MKVALTIKIDDNVVECYKGICKKHGQPDWEARIWSILALVNKS